MKKLVKQFTLLLIILLNIRCENILLDNNPQNSPSEVFEAFWKGIDEKYAYFELKNINWDSVYLCTKPLTHDNMSDEELWNVLSPMLCVLKDDGHTSLSGDGKETQWNACNNTTYKKNFDYNLLIKNYISTPIKYSGPIMYEIIDDIGYMYYSSFGDMVTDENIDFLVDYFKNTKGLIIDIRGNQGGADENGNRIQSRMLNEKTLVEYIYYKNGPGHSDFTAPQKLHILPKGTSQYLKPIAVLTNRSCYSSASNFASRMWALPHVSLIGDTTLGGAGRPKFFDLPNGWLVRYSSNYALRVDGYNYENGVPPDYYVELESTDKANGKDAIIEFAISWIKSNQ